MYNVPYGTCPQWIGVGEEDSGKKVTHRADYLLLTSECRNNRFSVSYRIKLKRKLHNVVCNGKWKDNEPQRELMESLYRKHGACYGGKLISEILDNHTPLFTFEAERILNCEFSSARARPTVARRSNCDCKLSKVFYY